MKITDLKILRTATPTQAHTNWLFVKIETDSGIHGIGEGSLQYKDAALAAELEEFKRFLIGKDPFQIEHIWTSLYRRVTWTGGPVTMSAISAIDLALWDIKGKALDVPVYELLGGKVRERVKAYANGWFGGTTVYNSGRIRKPHFENSINTIGMKLKTESDERVRHSLTDFFCCKQIEVRL